MAKTLKERFLAGEEIVFKIESLKSVLNIRALVKPDITYVDFGPADLALDIETHDHPTLKTVDDCRQFARIELAGVAVSIR